MDPNANVREQESLLAMVEPGVAMGDSDRARLGELRRALAGWIRGGGFAPTWSAVPLTVAYYRRAGALGLRSAVPVPAE